MADRSPAATALGTTPAQGTGGFAMTVNLSAAARKLFRRFAALASVSAAVALLGFPANQAKADAFTFRACTSNDPVSVNIGIAQMSVTLSDLGSGQVRFDFFNAGAESSSLAQVYFDDGPFSGLGSLVDADDGVGGDSGVDFSTASGSLNLPSGENCPDGTFDATAGFKADPAGPVKGVNPGEQLGIIFNLESGETFDDVESDLASGEFRIGIHVIAYDNGESETYVSGPSDGGTIITEPTTLVIFGLGLLALGISRRRRRA